MTQNTAPKKFKRSQTVVDREVQYGVVKKIAVHWLVLFVCNSIALMIWVTLFEQPEMGWRDNFAESFRRFLPFFVITAALIPAFVLDTLKLTNRFAGPISKLRGEMKNAADGKPVRPLHFRSDDYWCEVADGFNALIAKAGIETTDSDTSKGKASS